MPDVDIDALDRMRHYATGPSDSTRERPWLICYSQPGPILQTKGTLHDARTGVLISNRVLRRCVPRLERARISGQPTRIVLFVRDAAGDLVILGDDVQRESAWVRVIDKPSTPMAGRRIVI